MEPLFSILLKVNVSLLICYLLYRSVLRQLTFYHFNRIYLLASIIISAMVPFLSYSNKAKASIEAWRSATGMETMSLQYHFDDNAQMGFSQTLAILYWAGVGVMASVLLLQLCSLLALFWRSKKEKVLGRSVRTLDEPLSPFSFFKTIFINPNEYSFEHLTSILQHEKVHGRQWHSMDVLLGELKRIFCWFNPAAWLMLRAIRENLEFIADREVLQNGMDRKAYQYALLATQQTTGNNSLTNNFNFSHLKMRITMMNKTRSSDKHLLKYLLAVPVIALTPLLMASATSVSIPEEINKTKNNSSSTSTVSKTGQEERENSPNTDNGPGKDIMLSGHKETSLQAYNKIIRQETIVKTEFEVLGNASGPAQTLVVDHPGTSMPAAHFTIDNENRERPEVYETEVRFTPLTDSGGHRGTGHTVTASIKRKDNRNIPSKEAKTVAKEEPTFYHIYVDGVKQNKRSVTTFTEKNISIKYLKGQEAKDYSDEVKDGEGVMLVATK